MQSAAVHPAWSLMEPEFASVLASKTREQYRGCVVDFAARLGFDRVSAMLVTDRSDGPSTFQTVHNAPRGYLSVINDAERNLHDPVMQHCKRQSLPILWDRSTYVESGLLEKWETQAQFGYRCGIAVVLHMPGGRHYFLGVDRDQDMPRDRGEVTALVASLQTFAVHAHETASAVFGQAANLKDEPRLSKRELEALRWTADGKNAREVAAALGISERTAAIHLMRATRKLGCANKLHAAVTAVQLRLIVV